MIFGCFELENMHSALMKSVNYLQYDYKHLCKEGKELYSALFPELAKM
jgi:hypothetical protein